MKLAIMSGKKPLKKAMTRRKKEPLCKITEKEQKWLVRNSRSHSEPASHVAEAKEILAVAEGISNTQAAQVAVRKSRDAVSQLVRQFNSEGIATTSTQHGGGPKRKYTTVKRERVLRDIQRSPDLEKDGSQTWSLMLLQKALLKTEDGLPEISTERR